MRSHETGSVKMHLGIKKLLETRIKMLLAAVLASAQRTGAETALWRCMWRLTYHPGSGLKLGMLSNFGLLRMRYLKWHVLLLKRRDIVGKVHFCSHSPTGGSNIEEFCVVTTQ